MAADLGLELRARVEELAVDRADEVERLETAAVDAARRDEEPVHHARTPG